MISGPLDGQLVYVFLAAIFIAAILAWIALLWYRRAIARQMRGQAAPSGAPPLPPPLPPPLTKQFHRDATVSDGPLQIAVFRPRQSAADAAAREWPIGWRRVAAAYAIGAALFSAVITAALLPELEEIYPSTVLGTWWMHAWPVVPSLIALLLLDRRSGLKVAAVYVAGGAVAIALLTFVLQVLRGTFTSAPLTNMFWLVVGIAHAAYAPLAVIALTARRRIRAVVPLALACTLYFGFALLVFREAITRAFNAPALRDVLLELAALTSVEIAYYSLYMLLALPAGWLAWRSLEALAAAFERKRFSDVQLVVDCWWLIVTAANIVTLAGGYGFAAIAIGVTAFAAYRTGTFLMLRLTRREPGASPTRLLLLRVFGFQGRTESLFDRVAERWRFRGPVQLIAGADLAMRTADPGDILAFVGGRLPDVYVSQMDHVAERMRRLDMQRDPDDRYRVNDVFCLNETWQEALRQLLSLSDLVVMDLRGFTAERRGCVFELEQLVRNVPAEAIVLVCDATTDMQALADVLYEAWLRAQSAPGLAARAPVSLVKVETGSLAELDALMQRLLGRATPQKVVAIADLVAGVG